MARTPNERQDDTDLRVAVGVIQSQMKRVEDSLSRVETKIDNNSYVHETKYLDDRKSDAAEYATKEEIKPIKNMFYAILTTIVLGLITAFMTFVIKGGIK
jgi:hypothetical protein